MRLAMAVTALALALTLLVAILLVVRLRMDTLAAKEDDCQFMLTSSECANYQPNMCAVDGEEGVCLVHFDCPLERQLANKPPAYTDPCPEHYFCCSQADDKRRSAQVDADCSMHPEGVWSAAVLWRNGSSWEFQCMATFLSERVLLATAGCVERLAAHGKDFAKGMKVRVDVGPEWQQQDANVVRVVLAGTRLAALLLLDTTSLPSRHEHHACLPNIGDDFSNSLCLLIGYGEDGNKYYQEKRYLPTNECEQNTEEHLVCAENTSEDLCLVSAGSPLVCDLDEVWVLAGFSLGCGDSKDRYLRSNLAVAWADLYLQNWTQTVPLKPIATR